MELYSIVIFIMAILIGLSALTEKLPVPRPTVLIIAGMLIGFTPGLPHITIDPEVVFLIFLPPLLFDAAFKISLQNFRRDINIISSMAVVMVFVTTTAIAVAAYYLIPGLSWPMAFVLGAILSPPDAVAATSATKGLGLSKRTVTILEGESLVNDASGLIAYRFAVAAVAGSVFVFWKAAIDFVITMGGGILIGLILGKIFDRVYRGVYENTHVAVSLTILTPFVAYLLAEEMNVSGVLSVVTAGFVASYNSEKALSPASRTQANSFWDTIIFLLNGLVFILIGLEFPYVVGALEADVSMRKMIGYAFLLTAVCLIVRFFGIIRLAMGLKHRKKYLERKKLTPEIEQLKLKDAMIIGWSGMRGIVSLATALALPVTMSNGSPFPQRNTIIFLAVVVVLITLLVQGLTLPLLVKRLNKRTLEQLEER